MRFTLLSFAILVASVCTAPRALAWNLPTNDDETLALYTRLSTDYSGNLSFKNSQMNNLRDGTRSTYVSADDPFVEQANPISEDVLNILPDGKWISYKVFNQAITGFRRILANFPSAGIRKNLLTIVDFNQKTESRRFMVIDLENEHVLFQTWVHHGRNSDMDTDRHPESFSNIDGSYRSSPGFLITSDAPYMGSWGYSLRMHGIDGGLNSNVFSRNMVIHPWPSIHARELATLSPYETSLGCLALPYYESGKFYGREDQPLSRLIIDTIKGRSVIYATTSEVDLPSKSIYLKTAGLLESSVRSAILARINRESFETPAFNSELPTLPAAYRYWSSK